MIFWNLELEFQSIKFWFLIFDFFFLKKGYCLGNILGEYLKLGELIQFQFISLAHSEYVLCWCCDCVWKGPQMWKSEYKPRNRVPWSIITTCIILCACMLLGMRYHFKTQTQARDKVLISEHSTSSSLSQQDSKDLTDLENSSQSPPCFAFLFFSQILSSFKASRYVEVWLIFLFSLYLLLLDVLMDYYFLAL